MPDSPNLPRAAELRKAAARVGTSCACFNLRKAARAVTQLYDDALRPSGLRTTQFTLLALLAGHGAMGVNELAAASVTDRTTLTRNLAVLEREGLVRTRAANADARIRLAELTDFGRERLSVALPLWERVQDQMQGRLGRAPLAALRGALAGVVDAAT